MTQEVTGVVDPVMKRLEEQIEWYDGKSIQNRKTYKQIKLIEIMAAALIPFMAPLKFPYANTVTGGLGVLITVLEGMIHLNQYQRNWINYRSTCEALKHEKYIFFGNGGAYAGVNDPRAVLAERIEGLISQEETKWASMQVPEDKR